jgi:hypothetical protein
LVSETRNKINFLDITINKQHNKLTFGIYKEPATTDTILHNKHSSYLNEHKKRAAINYLLNRMNTYQLTPVSRAQEKAIINQILTNNGYQQQTTHDKHKHNATDKTKWEIFTYHGPDTRTITKLFRNTNKKAYKTTNSIKHHLKLTNQVTDTYSKSGVYQLEFVECHMKYIAQTGRTFKARFKEHIQDIRTNRHNSKFEQHILDTGHA